MSAYEATRSVEIAAPVQACFDVLTDYEHLADWQGNVRAADVLERDEQGRGTEVAYEVDAKIKTVRYRLAHDYDEPHRIGSTYLGGDFRHFEGDYALSDTPAGCTITLRLAIDPGLRLPRPMVRIVNEAVMGRALSELRDHVQSLQEA
ncbi:MAG: type II toxin-antitoxin system RatA family toxin [Solirubrobacteraceae bacterium]